MSEYQSTTKERIISTAVILLSVASVITLLAYQDTHDQLSANSQTSEVDPGRSTPSSNGSQESIDPELALTILNGLLCATINDPAHYRQTYNPSLPIIPNGIAALVAMGVENPITFDAQNNPDYVIIQGQDITTLDSLGSPKWKRMSNGTYVCIDEALITHNSVDIPQ